MHSFKINLCFLRFKTEFKASSLNTNDVFVLCHQSTTFYIWYGRASTGEERETAKSIVVRRKREPVIVIENQEKNEFWAALGKNEKDHSDVHCSPEKASRSYAAANSMLSISLARLYEICYTPIPTPLGSPGGNKLCLEEVYQFKQGDLNPSDVMLLDAWEVVFIWIGRGD